MDATGAEFLRYMITSALLMGLGLGAAAYVRFRHNTAHRAFRRLVYYYIGLLALIAVLTAGADVSEVRCRGNPMEWCRYNDSLPVIALVVFAWLLVVLPRARFLYNDR